MRLTIRANLSRMQDFHIRWGWLWTAVTCYGRLLLYRIWV